MGALFSINFIFNKHKKYKNTTKIKWLTQKYNKNQMTHYICWGLEDLRPIWRLRTTCGKTRQCQQILTLHGELVSSPHSAGCFSQPLGDQPGRGQRVEVNKRTAHCHDIAGHGKQGKSPWSPRSQRGIEPKDHKADDGQTCHAVKVESNHSDH